MAHSRQRHCKSNFSSKAKLWPIVGILGPRQIGKSTFLKEQLTVPTRYLSLDDKELREKAETQPGRFLETYSENNKTLVIDEIQKSPSLFDALKLVVDKKRRPGAFFVSGSTQFSEKIGIRESLTGRIGLVRLYTLTMRELLAKDFTNPWVSFFSKKNDCEISYKEVARLVHSGGMPGLCFLRNEVEQSEYTNAWLDATCNRDLLQIKKGRLNGDDARECLEAIATLETATTETIGRHLQWDLRKVTRYLESFETLFLVHKLAPSRLSTGKSRYFIFDSGIARVLGSSELVRTKITLINECLAQFEYSKMLVPRIKFYESRRKSIIDFVFEKEKKAIIIASSLPVHAFELRRAEAFLKKHPGYEVIYLTSGSEVGKEGKIRFIPLSHCF